MKRLLCLLLALVMALALTACSGSSDEDGKKLPDLDGKTTTDTDAEQGDPAAAEADLSWLRDSLRVGGYIFGTVSFGYVDEGMGLTAQEWANTMDPATCALYSFIPLIPDGQIVGTEGCLLCVVPADSNATVSVNRIRWHENGDGFEQEEVLYRSESGDPILLFVSDDPNMPGFSSVQVNIVGDNGFVDWYPTVDEETGWIDLADDGEGNQRGCNIQADGPGAGSDDIGWQAPAEEQLTSTVWSWDGTMSDGGYACGTLSLTGDADHSASLVWQYENDAVYREIYTGMWSYSEESAGERGYLLLRMELVGGSEYDLGKRGSCDSVFPVAVPMAFEDFPFLMIDEADGGVRLPFQTDMSPSVVLYPGAMG